MRNKLKLDFKSLEQELDLLTDQQQLTVLGGLMNSNEKNDNLNFYQSIFDNDKWSLWTSFDSKYPGHKEMTEEEKLKYLRDKEDPFSSLSVQYREYLLSADLLRRAKLLADANTNLSATQQDEMQLQMQADSANLFNVVNDGGPGSTGGGQRYLVVKTADELRKYFRATGMEIEVHTNLINGEEVISNLIIPDRKPSSDPYTTGEPILIPYQGYGINDISQNTTINKGKYANQYTSVYQVDIVGLSNYLAENGFNPLYNALYRYSGETSTSDGTTSDDMSSASIPVTNPGTTYFGTPNPH